MTLFCLLSVSLCLLAMVVDLAAACFPLFLSSPLALTPSHPTLSFLPWFSISSLAVNYIEDTATRLVDSDFASFYLHPWHPPFPSNSFFCSAFFSPLFFCFLFGSQLANEGNQALHSPYISMVTQLKYMSTHGSPLIS